MLAEVNGEPRNYNEALKSRVKSVKSKEWKTAMQREMDAVVENST